MVQASEEDDALAESLGAAYDEQGRLVEPVPAWQQPERQSEQRQMMLALQNCIGHLPRQTRQVFMMHSCRRAAELITLGFDEPLGMFDRILLRLHLSMCGSCRNVRTQLVSLEAMTGELFSGCAEEDGDDAFVSPPSFRFKDSTPGGGSPGARP